MALDWCSASAQGLLTLKPESADFIEDYFHVWQRRQLNKTLGQVNSPTAAGGLDSAVVQSVERLASATHQLAKGQAAHQATAAAAQSTAQAQAAATGDKDKKVYNKHQMSVLKGFCRVKKLSGVPPIWGLFQKALGTESHRDNIAVMMKAWAKAHGEQIDVGVFYTKAQLEDMQNMRFNPGASSATYKNAEKMISILA